MPVHNFLPDTSHRGQLQKKPESPKGQLLLPGDPPEGMRLPLRRQGLLNNRSKALAGFGIHPEWQINKSQEINGAIEGGVEVDPAGTHPPALLRITMVGNRQGLVGTGEKGLPLLKAKRFTVPTLNFIPPLNRLSEDCIWTGLPVDNSVIHPIQAPHIKFH
jgi:hypothetical protein